MPRGQWDRRDAKPTVEAALSLDMRWLCAHGLRDGRPIGVLWQFTGCWRSSVTLQLLRGGGHVAIVYGVDGETRSEAVPVTASSCNFGGFRWWWLCPGCGRRCAILYHEYERFECRTCCGLTYTSSQSTEWVRRTRKTERVRKRLGIVHGERLRKPKGMHWTTFERLLDEYDATNTAAWDAMRPTLERWEAELGRRLSARR
jgi:hypothetical protein